MICHLALEVCQPTPEYRLSFTANEDTTASIKFDMTENTGPDVAETGSSPMYIIIHQVNCPGSFPAHSRHPAIAFDHSTMHIHSTMKYAHHP